MKISSLMYFPKMHKSPDGSTFIIASTKCTLKPLSKDITAIFKLFLEAVTRDALLVKVFLEVSQNSQEYTWNSIKKETLVQVVSCKFCEISNNTIFTERLWVTAHVFYKKIEKFDAKKWNLIWGKNILGYPKKPASY